MLELLTQHQFWTAVVVYWIFSAAVSSMPDPAANCSSGYLWPYRFLHTIAGNITTAFARKNPGLKTLSLLLVALLGAVSPPPKRLRRLRTPQSCPLCDFCASLWLIFP